MKGALALANRFFASLEREPQTDRGSRLGFNDLKCILSGKNYELCRFTASAWPSLGKVGERFSCLWRRWHIKNDGPRVRGPFVSFGDSFPSPTLLFTREP